MLQVGVIQITEPEDARVGQHTATGEMRSFLATNFGFNEYIGEQLYNSY